MISVGRNSVKSGLVTLIKLDLLLGELFELREPDAAVDIDQWPRRE